MVFRYGFGDPFMQFKFTSRIWKAIVRTSKRNHGWCLLDFDDADQKLDRGLLGITVLEGLLCSYFFM